MPLLDRWLSKIGAWVSPSFPDLGTAFLGIAAILLARAIPSSNFRDIDIVLVIIGVGVGFIGLALRRIARQ